MTNSSPANAAHLRARLADLARTYAVRDIYAFGSRAHEIAARTRGTAHQGELQPNSDVDVGVRPQFGKLAAVDERVDLTHALEALFGVARVDLVILPEAGAFLALAVVSGELLYCADPTEQAEYELYVLRQAGDLMPFERERRELILRHGAR
jgi:predicted nucleotidyltransferase